MKAVAFWDSSALVPLCVSQTRSVEASDLYDKYRIAVWWTTHVEIVSALGRLSRMKQLTDEAFIHAQRQAEELANLWRVVRPSRAVESEARRLVIHHALRAADALQLAAALAWCENRPKGNVFISFDRHLSEAAISERFAPN